jgi:hypothetical protein
MLMFVVLACGTVVTETAYYTCPTEIPLPTPTTLLGTPQSTPRPIPTPYRIEPPQDFYVGDAVFVGQPGASMRLRFRLMDVATQPASPLNGKPRQLVSWSLEITNLGDIEYETLPTVKMTIRAIATANEELTDSWYPSLGAMKAAGIPAERYIPIVPGETRSYRLAAIVPAGNVQQFAYLLDDDGQNRLTWVNQTNPHCADNNAI